MLIRAVGAINVDGITNHQDFNGTHTERGREGEAKRERGRGREGEVKRERKRERGEEREEGRESGLVCLAGPTTP